MSAEFRRKSALFILSCLLVVFAFSAWSGSKAPPPVPSPYDDEEYKEIIAQQVGDIYGLEAWAAAVQDDFMPILPPVPELILRQSGGPEVLPFNAKSFPPAFVSGMAGIYENSVPVYPVLVVEDPTTRALTFYNLDNQPLYTLPPPPGYDPFAFLRSRWPSLFNGGANEAARRNMMRLYDPARIQAYTKLIAADQLALWIYTKRQIEAAQALQSGGGAVEMKMMLGDAPNSNIFFTAVKRMTNYVSMTIRYPSGFTNGLDVFTCNDLMAEIWSFAVKNLATTGTNLTWLDTNTWVVTGIPNRMYAAGDATMDGDGDGYADAREIMVYGTDPMAATSHPVTVSGAVSYSGIETGGVYMLFTQDADSWSIAKSIRQASPSAYTNDEIGNGQAYWFKAFRDANGNFAKDAWEPRGIYSSSSTYVTGNLAGVDIAMADVPSAWGQINYSGSATGDIHVIAVSGSNSWDTAYQTVIPYVQGPDTNGAEYYVTFPVSYMLTGMPASNYWIRAFMDTDTNGMVSLLDPAGQYSSNAIPVSNRATGINITLAPDADADGLPDGWELQYWGNLLQNPGGDADGDGMTNGAEYAAGTNPTAIDSDGDGVPDGPEADAGCTSPTVTDTFTAFELARMVRLPPVKVTVTSDFPTIWLTTNLQNSIGEFTAAGNVTANSTNRAPCEWGASDAYGNAAEQYTALGSGGSGVTSTGTLHVYMDHYSDAYGVFAPDVDIGIALAGARITATGDWVVDHDCAESEAAVVTQGTNGDSVAWSCDFGYVTNYFDHSYGGYGGRDIMFVPMLPQLQIAPSSTYSCACGSNITLTATSTTLAYTGEVWWTVSPVVAGGPTFVGASGSLYRAGSSVTLNLGTNAGVFAVSAAPWGVAQLSATAVVGVLKAGMTAYRPTTEGPTYNNPFQRREIPEAQEETPGAGIRVNGDDDNVNSTPDRNDTTVNNENDLIEVVLDAAPPAPSSGFKYVLKRSASNIKAWTTQSKTTALLDANSETNLTFSTTPMTVWVENPNGGAADLELQAKTDSGTVVCSDKVHFYPFTSVVIVFGGEFQDVVTDPPPAGAMIYSVATRLFQDGYDAHMYVEPDAGDPENSEDTVFDEIVSAVNDRQVTGVAVLGYSHGGGSTWRVADRLNTRQPPIGLQFSAYVDAVTQDAITQETRRPPGSAYHANYYQEGSIADGWLDGGPIDNPPGANHQVNHDDPTATETHTTIDDEPAVLDDVVQRLSGQVNR